MLKHINTRILLSFVTVVVAAAVIIGATFAFFSDTETSQNNTLTAGALDLKIDNTSYYNGVLNPGTTWTLNDLTNQLFFNFTDVKPSDLGEDTISFHADNNYWLCANTKVTENSDNTCTGPELIDDPTCDASPTATSSGELAQNINFVFWADDGDNVLETGEKVFMQGNGLDVLNRPNIALADSSVNNLGGADGTPATGGATLYVGKAWCFGTLTQSPLVQDGVNNVRTPANTTGGVLCNGASLNNATQTDRVLADIKFTAVQSRNNPGFICGARPTPSLTPSPTPTISTTPTPSLTPVPSEPFVDSVTAVNGTFGHCCDVNDLSSSPAVAAAAITGPNDSPPGTSFIQISGGSSITARFDNNKAVDGPGNDIKIWTYDTLFPADANIEISADPLCLTGFSAPVVRSDTVNGEIDLATLTPALTEARCVKITDLNGPDHTFPSLGFDLDAIEALHSVVFP